MLCLTRKTGEKVVIGNEIEVMILRVGPNSVRIGITAPGLNIARSELIDPSPHVEDKTLDCGSLGQINPNPIATGLARGIDKPKHHHHED